MKLKELYYFTKWFIKKKPLYVLTVIGIPIMMISWYNYGFRFIAILIITAIVGLVIYLVSFIINEGLVKPIKSYYKEYKNEKHDIFNTLGRK